MKEEPSGDIADQFEVISHSEVKDIIEEANEEQEEEGEEESEDEDEEDEEEEESESIHEIRNKFGLTSNGKLYGNPHSKPHSAQRQWKHLKSSPSRTTGVLGLMNNDDEVELVEVPSPIEEVKESSISIHTD